MSGTCDRGKGLINKYFVDRVDDPTGKHLNCEYYVLDMHHDKFAIPALEAYAEACQFEYPQLAVDLYAKVLEMKERFK